MKLFGVLSCLFLACNAEIIYRNTPGMWLVWPTPQTIPYTNGNPPGTTITALVYKQVENISIALLAKDNSTLFEYPLEHMYRTVCLTLATEQNGFRVFVNGIFRSFFSEDITKAAGLYVNNIGTMNAMLAVNEPSWIFPTSIHFSYNFAPNGISIPQSFHVSNVDLGDYFTVIGKFDNSTVDFEISLDTKFFDTPLLFKLRTRNEPRYTMSSIYNAVENFTEPFTGKVITMDDTTNEVVITLVCEMAGWRVFINGNDFLFYYHRQAYNAINKIKFGGEIQNGSNWKVLNVIHGNQRSTQVHQTFLKGVIPKEEEDNELNLK